MPTLVIKAVDNDGRLAPLVPLLATPWQVVVADHGNHDAFSAALADADALISMNWKADFPPAPKLRLVQLPGAGTDDLDLPAVPPGVTVCNAFEHEIGIAEYVMAAMLEWQIGVLRMHAQFRAGRWWGSFLAGPRHGDLHGKTLGIVGYGRIGREVAKRVHAFGMHVIAASRTPLPPDPWCEQSFGTDRLHELLSVADFVLTALPLNAASRGLIGRTAFASMQPGAVIINVGRGATIDEQALFEACRDRRIGGAVIDTWYRYPAQGSAEIPEARPSAYPFHELDNVVMTPHGSAWSEALAGRRCRVMAQNLDRLFRGEPLVNIVRAPLIATPACDFHPQATLRCASPLERASALGKPFEH